MRVPAAAAKPLASRPLTMAIELTPAVSASRQARSFATMPADAVPSEIIWSMPSTSSVSIVAPDASNTPAVAPAMISRSARQRRRERGRERVGVHVQHLPVRLDAQTRNRRHVAVRQQIEHQRRRPIGARLSDQAEIDEAPVHRLVRRRAHRQAEARVDAGQPDRRHAARDERGDQARVDRARQHRDDGLERRLVGDAQAFDRVLRHVAARRLGVNLASAAVHDDERAFGGERGDAGDHLRQARARFEQLAAQLEQRQPLATAGVSTPIRAVPPFRRSRTRR